MRRHLLVFLLCGGCLPTLPPSPDAGSTPDAAERRFAVEALVLTDRAGRVWDEGDAPRHPILTIALSSPPWPDAEPPVWLLRGPPDDELRDDLRAAPLRASHRERALAIAVVLEGDRWVVSTDEGLSPGDELTLAIGSWARDGLTGTSLDEPFVRALRISRDPEAGADVTASWPADGASGVSPSIDELAMRFDGPVEGIADGLRVLDGARAIAGEAAIVPCELVGWADGWCARFVPSAPLRGGADHALAIDGSVLDRGGAPIGPWQARFRTALTDDVLPPTLSAISCGLDELADEAGCLLVDDARAVLRVQASEPVRGTFTLDGRVARAIAPRGDAVFEIRELAPDAAFVAHLRLEDAGGLRVERELAFRTAPPLATVAVVEVRSDPMGAEPRQEYVELLNWGTMPVDLEGFSISDRPDALGDVIERSMPLLPGQRALLVADGFDPDDTADDTAVPPGVPLVRIGTSLGSGGLSNGGEPVLLRDPDLYRVSAAPGWSTGPGRCLTRVGDAMRVDDAASWAIADCAPGAGSR